MRRSKTKVNLEIHLLGSEHGRELLIFSKISCTSRSWTAENNIPEQQRTYPQITFIFRSTWYCWSSPDVREMSHEKDPTSVPFTSSIDLLKTFRTCTRHFKDDVNNLDSSRHFLTQDKLNSNCHLFCESHYVKWTRNVSIESQRFAFFCSYCLKRFMMQYEHLLSASFNNFTVLSVSARIRNTLMIIKIIAETTFCKLEFL